ncbi:His/Glu/Gln/Arg/opine family ABC transporter [Rubellimicrobium mesophilum DSM 19309]|uniref:His/Glu/Gln/Arg/opine family ABC transporter n=1 Tax=Rubellimicrobium mesophilum DSM 19309 TaxID=442562 RepID=A0A017HVJ7_9RHOB|nr:transporter substrate-binding domain-containing protein [Rubellimicrobium mesophilum]EYD78350.1 His/Glu/Gln/Arg/opine family ABC transporter [Rubellimicrobium mesophilum DSM 19309]
MRNLILAAGLALAASGAWAQDTVRLATEGAYPPYNFINDQGELDGFEIELGNALCEHAGLTCTWVQNDWDSIIPNLLAGNYDAIMAGMNITDERDKVIDFTQNYTPPATSAYVGTSPDADTMGTVAAQVSTIHSSYIADSGATLVEFPTADEAVAAARNGEADVAFADYDYLTPIVAASGGELTFIGDPIPIGRGVGVGLRESDAELRGKLDDAIGAMKADGSLNELITKWFPENPPTF